MQMTNLVAHAAREAAAAPFAEQGPMASPVFVRSLATEDPWALCRVWSRAYNEEVAEYIFMARTRLGHEGEA